MPVRIEFGPGSIDGPSEGIFAIEVDGPLLKIEGWYDSGPAWDGERELTDEQRELLRKAFDA